MWLSIQLSYCTICPDLWSFIITFQFEPHFDPRRWNLMNRKGDTSQEIILEITRPKLFFCMLKLVLTNMSFIITYFHTCSPDRALCATSLKYRHRPLIPFTSFSLPTASNTELSTSWSLQIKQFTLIRIFFIYCHTQA